MQITLNPWDPSARPDIKFFGPTRLIDKYLHSLTENIEDWDSEYDIVQSILRLLGKFILFCFKIRLKIMS